MTSTTQQSRFTRGGDNAVEADDALKAARGGSGGSFRKTNYLPKIGKDNHIFMRYLTDSPDWVYVDSHSFVPTKGAPSWWPKDKRFPETMPSVCRYDKAFREVKKEGTDEVLLPAIYTDCYIDDAELKNQWDRLCKPSVKVLALAILREEVIGTKEMAAGGMITEAQIGKRVGFKDATREVEQPKRDDKGEVIKDGEGKAELETITEPAIIVVNQAVSNYFAGLQSMYGMYGTICDRDFAVKQKDEKKDVEFIHMPLDPMPSLKPGEPAWTRYEEAIKAQGESVDIEAILMDRSSDDYYALFFDPSKEAKQRGGDAQNESSAGNSTSPSSAPESQQEAAPSNDVEGPDMLAQMRDRVRGVAATTPAPQEAPKTPEATKEPEAPSSPAPAGPATQIDFSAP